MGLGLLVPLALLIARGQSVGAVGLAGGLIAATGIVTKLNLIPGLAVLNWSGLAMAYTGPGLTPTPPP